MLGFVGLVVFVTMALAAPLAPPYPTYKATLRELSNSTSTNLVRRLDPNECPASKNRYPTFSSWERAMNQFCDNHGNQKVYWDKPLIMTLTISGRDGKPIDWVFGISVDNGNPPEAAGQLQWNYYPGAKLCKGRFMGFTKGKGGGVGKVYCNWNHSKKNIHDQLMLGGRYDESLNKEYFAKVIWETRAKRGQQGV